MSRTFAFLLLIVFWALIYLPALGSTEIKGEEGRRILPATAMLESGDWLVPHLHDERYLRKPPLINWVIAGSFALTGVRNEWTARLPSALAVLLMGCTVLLLAGRAGWMDLPTGFTAALFVMTPAGLLAKARFAGAEIEGIYVALFGIAVSLWLGWRAQGRSPWLWWLVPAVFLGLGLLAKGPPHLLFFYVVVLAVCFHQKRLGDLLHPAHFAGIAIMAAIAAAWVLPLLASPAGPEVIATWHSEGVERFTDSEFNPGNYWSNVPRWLGDLFPWLLLAPAAWFVLKQNSPGREAGTPRHWAAPVLLAATVASVAALFIPGMLPRYVLPLGIPWMIALTALVAERPPLIAWHRSNQVAATILVLTALVAPPAAAAIIGKLPSGGEGITAFDWPRALPAIAASTFTFILAAVLWSRRNLGLTLFFTAAGSAAILSAASLLYATAAVPWIIRFDNLRPLAAQIDRSLPPGSHLVIYRANYQPALFYLRTPHRYIRDSDKLTADTPFVLVPARNADRLRGKRPDFEATFTFTRNGEPELVLFQPIGTTDSASPPN